MSLDVVLRELQSSGLLRPASDGEASLAFRQLLTQDAAYQSLLYKRRAAIHGEVARAYERLYPDRRSEFAGMLAHHYGEAGDEAKTLEYAQLAGDSAARISARTEAISYYSQALTLAAKLDASSDLIRDLYLKRGRVFELSGQYEQALENYAELEKRAARKGDRRTQLASVMAETTLRSIPTRLYDLDLAQRLSDRALGLARELEDKPAEAKIYWNLLLLNSRVHYNIPKAIWNGEQSLAIARSMGLAEQIAYTLNDLSPSYTVSGQAEKGEAANLEARAYWVQSGNLPMLADNYGYASMSHTVLGRFRDAVEDSRTGLELSRKIRNLWGEAHSQLWVGRAYVNLGEITEAEMVMKEAIRLVPLSGFVAPLIISRSALGMLYGEAGQVERGIGLARAAIHYVLTPSSTATAIAAGCAARLAIMNRDWSGAEEYLEAGHKAIEKTESGFGLPIYLYVAEAEFELARGNLVAALEKLSGLASSLEQLDLKQELPLVLMLKGETQARLQHLDEAESTLVHATSIAEDCEAHWPLWRILLKRAWVARLRGKDEDARGLEIQSRAEFDYVLARTPADLRDSFHGQWEANLHYKTINVRN